MEAIKKLLGDNYTDDIAKAIEAEISAQVNGGAKFVPKEKFDTINEQYKGLKATVAERDKQLEELTPKAAGNEALIAKIEELQQANKTATDEAVKKLQDKYINDKISSYKPISAKALKAELDLSKVEFDEEFNIKGLDEQINSLKGDDRLKMLFEQEATPPPTGTGIKAGASDGDMKTEPLLKKVY